MGSKRVLIVGSGAREHALAWRLARDDEVAQVLVAPGNGGTAGGKISNVPSGSAEQLAEYACEQQIDLTVVGPEAALAAGIADEFARRKKLLLGPSKAAARIESSKKYAKQFMHRCGIPTAAAQDFSDLDSANAFLDSAEPPFVIKADGLAAGKGVVITDDRLDAMRVCKDMLAGRYGQASRTILIEQHKSGTEMTLIALCGGKHAAVLGTSQDYKRLGEGDAGPNTGGMGAISPAPVAAGLDVAQLAERFIQPVLDGMREQGCEFRGFLYAGLIIDSSNRATVLEYNCRLGDPEAQVLLPLLDGNCFDLFQAAALGELGEHPIAWSSLSCVAVVMASRGYPSAPQTGSAIALPEDSEDSFVFHAATERDAQGVLRSCGGRVLCVSSWDQTAQAARAKTYAAVEKIDFPSSVYRRDIAAQ